MIVEKVTIKYNGISYEFPEQEAGFNTLTDQLDLNPNNPTDAQVFNAVCAALQVPSLDGFVIGPPESERLAGQHDSKTVLNIRPPAQAGLC